jgi:ABC-type sugar transport system ATPase subunit
VIVLEALTCEGPPSLIGLHLTLQPGEIPAVLCTRVEERVAFVELLSGERSETSGRITMNGEPLSPRQRRAMVVAIPTRPSLSPYLSANEHVRVVASMRKIDPNPALVAKVLELSTIEDPDQLCEKLSISEQLRLTVSLALLGRPALAIALDPPVEIQRLLPALKAPDRSLLAVGPAVGELGQNATHLFSLADGHLQEGASALTRPVTEVRRYALKISLPVAESSPKDPKSLFAHHPGVLLRKVADGDYLLELSPNAVAPRVLRTLIQAGFRLEAITEAGRGRSQ